MSNGFSPIDVLDASPTSEPTAPVGEIPFVPRNNLGNIRLDANSFREYITPEEGYQAIHDNLLAYQNKHKINTPRGIVSRWAPPSENDTETLIRNMSQRTGYDPDMQLDLNDQTVRDNIARAIVVQEHGNRGLEAIKSKPVIPEGPIDVLGGDDTPVVEIDKSKLYDIPQKKKDPLFINQNIVPAFKETIANLPPNTDEIYNSESPFLGALGGAAKSGKDAVMALAGGGLGFVAGTAAGLPAALSAPFADDPKARLQVASRISAKVAKHLAYEPSTRLGELSMMPFEIAFGTAKGSINKVVENAYGPDADPIKVKQVQDGANYLFDLAVLGHGTFKGKGKDARVGEDAGVLKDAMEKAVKDSIEKVEVGEVPPAGPTAPDIEPLPDVNAFKKATEDKAKVETMSRATFEGNQDVVDHLRTIALSRTGRSKSNYNFVADHVAGLDIPVEGADLTGVKRIGDKSLKAIQEALGKREVAKEVEVPQDVPVVEESKPIDVLEESAAAPIVPDIKSMAETLDPALRYDGKMDGIPGITEDLHNFTVELPDGRQPSFSIKGEVTSEGLKEVLDKKVEEFKPKEGIDALTPESIQKEFESFKEETPVPVFDDIKLAKGEGYSFPSKRTYPDEPSARLGAEKRGEGFEVVQVGDKFRVGKFTDIEAHKFESLDAVEAGGWELMSEISREQAKGEVPSEGFGIAEVDGKYYRVSERVDMPEPASMRGEAAAQDVKPKEDIWSDDVSPEDWAALKAMTDEATWKEVTAREELQAIVEVAKKTPPEVKAMSNAEKVAKFKEWQDSYVTLCDVATKKSEKVVTKVRKKKVTKEDLAPLDNNFKVFDSMEAAQAYLDATGSGREIIPDPLTGKFMLEPELPDIKGYEWDRDMDVISLEDMDRQGNIRDYELSETGTRDLLDIFGDERGSVNTDIIKEIFKGGKRVINNETGSIDLTPLRVMVDKLEKIVRTSRAMKLSPEEYLKSINVPIDIREQYLKRISELPNARQLLREKGTVVDRILNPEPSEIAQFGKGVKKKGEYVAQNMHLTKEDIAILEGSDRSNTHGTILVSKDPRTRKEVVTLQRNLRQKAMTALDTSINVANRLGVLGLRTDWREAKAGYKRRHQELHNELMDMRKQFTNKEIYDIGVVAMADMKGSKEAFEAMGISQVPAINAKQRAAIDRVKAMVNVLDEVNYVRTRTGRAPIPKLLDVNGMENYLPIMRAIESLNKQNRSGGLISLDNRVIAALAKNYNGMFNPNSLRRGKGYVPIEMDIFKVASRSLDYNLKEIYIAPVAAKAFAYANAKLQIPGMKEGIKGKVEFQNPALHEFLTNWANNIMGNDEVAAALEHRNKAFKTGIPLVMRNIVTAMIGGSVRTILIQPTALLGAVTIAGLPKTIAGITKTITGSRFGESSRAIKESNHLPIREFDSYMGEYSDYVSKGLISGWTKMAGDISLKPMAAVDLITAKAAWHTGYDLARSKGLKGKDAINFADDMVEKTQGSGDKGAVSPVQSNMASSWLFTLQTFAISDFNFIASDVLGIKNPDVSNKQTVGRVIRYVIGTQLIAAAYKSIGMENVVPDPMSAYMDEKEKGSSDQRAVAMAALEVVEKIPGVGGAMKYGSSILGPVGEWSKTLPMALKDSVKILDYNTMTDKQFLKYKLDMAKAVGFTFGIPGTSQIIKSIKAAKQGKELKDIIIGLPDYKGNQKGSGSGGGIYGSPSSGSASSIY